MTPTTLDNNRYHIIDKLGSGGFGETFLAADNHMPTKRRCVVKQLKPVKNNPQIYQLVQERFQREAAILEDLGENNQQIPRLYAYFAEIGEFYLVQEWIEGVTLSKKVEQQGVLSESFVKQILVDILPVLDYVHSKRIIHRDIKPDNIILRASDGKPVLIDFGAVRETMGVEVTTGGNATSSIVIGTPGFMPAEQSAGRAVYSSDLYSLGLTAIYLLAGKFPQEIETDYNTGEILWHRHALSVSPTMAGVLNKAIQYHPRDRYSSAKAMLDALQSNPVPILSTEISAQTPGSSGQTIVVSPPPTPINPAPPVAGNSHQGVIVGSAIAGGLIGASVLVGLAITRNPQPAPEAQATPSTTSEPIAVNTQAPVSKPAPEQAVIDYYANINNRNYQTAWNTLSPISQNNKATHPKGYGSFLEWWTQVDFIDVQGITPIETGSQTATVNASLKYSMKNRKPIYQSLRFFLVWDEASARWTIDNVKRISGN